LSLNALLKNDWRYLTYGQVKVLCGCKVWVQSKGAKQGLGGAGIGINKQANA